MIYFAFFCFEIQCKQSKHTESIPTIHSRVPGFQGLDKETRSILLDHQVLYVHLLYLIVESRINVFITLVTSAQAYETF